MIRSCINTQNHAVILLASGLSQRLGHSKQLLNKNSTPLISYMVKLALSTKPQVIVVVIPQGHSTLSALMAAWAIKEPNIQIVSNPKPAIGMGHSLNLAIEALTYFNTTGFDKKLNNDLLKRVLIMGVDQVLLDKSHLNCLLASEYRVVASGYSHWQFLDKAAFLEKTNDDLQADFETDLKDSSPKNIVGLPLVIDYLLLKQWQSKIGGDKGLRDLIRVLPAHQIKIISNQRLSYDIDTPSQRAYAKEQGWLDS